MSQPRLQDLERLFPVGKFYTVVNNCILTHFKSHDPPAESTGFVNHLNGPFLIVKWVDNTTRKSYFACQIIHKDIVGWIVMDFDNFKEWLVPLSYLGESE